MDIRDKVAIVTGAASGIGRATAVELARRGSRGVLLADLDEVGLADTAEQVTVAGSRAIAFRVDVTRAEDLEAMFRRAVEELGLIEIVVNNAGIVSGPWLAPLLEAIEILTPVEIAGEIARIVENDDLAGEVVVVENRPKVTA